MCSGCRSLGKRGSLVWTGVPWGGPAGRKGREGTQRGGNEDLRDRRELPEVRRGTWRTAKVYKREDGERRDTRRERAHGEELGDLETGGDEVGRKGLVRERSVNAPSQDGGGFRRVP